MRRDVAVVFFVSHVHMSKPKEQPRQTPCLSQHKLVQNTTNRISGTSSPISHAAPGWTAWADIDSHDDVDHYERY